MPSCAGCGVWFQQQTFKVSPEKDDMICSHCRASATPESYTNSYDWVCGMDSGKVLREH